MKKLYFRGIKEAAYVPKGAEWMRFGVPIYIFFRIFNSTLWKMLVVESKFIYLFIYLLCSSLLPVFFGR